MKNQGIKWSVPVLVERSEAGTLAVRIPEKVARQLKLGEKDVLNWTLLPSGSVEAWGIKKSTYSSLEDRGKK
jgi:hypothetical protein